MLSEPKLIKKLIIAHQMIGITGDVTHEPDGF